MSTRSQIIFQVQWKDNKKKLHTEQRMIYRHSDGYPSGVIPDLKEFLKWNSGRNSDMEYMTANFIYWSKRKFEELYWQPKGTDKEHSWRCDGERTKWSDFGSTNCSQLHIGFGVCAPNDFHMDIEYLYVVTVSFDEKDIKIEAYKVKNRKDWDTPLEFPKSFKKLKYNPKWETGEDDE